MKKARKKTFLLMVILAALMLVSAQACNGGDSGDDDADAAGDPVPEIEIELVEDPVEDPVPDESPDPAGDPADDPAPDPADDAVDTPAEEITPTDCSSIHEGTNSYFLVDGEPREFILNLPDGVEEGGPWAVVFNWHGLGDSAANMARMFTGLVNNEDMPFIGVTPEDTDFLLAGTMIVDWDVFAVTENNKEARLFDEVLACIEERFGVDEDHVHSVGFSLGGIVTDMLATTRGEQLASLVTYSGGYWSNPVNVTGMMSMVINWPEHSVDNTYAQIFLHGGTTDLYDMSLVQLHFDQYAINDTAFLNDKGHDAVICNHGLGHTAPPDFLYNKVIKFFADHPLGTADSPYADALPGDYPDYCEFSGKN
ncbi:MAG: hypothetical protein ABIJ56_19810 [Pseudomonadota bacterium]